MRTGDKFRCFPDMVIQKKTLTINNLKSFRFENAKLKTNNYLFC